VKSVIMYPGLFLMWYQWLIHVWSYMISTADKVV